MTEEGGSQGLRAMGEEAVGELAQALLDSPIFSQTMGRALGAGQSAMEAQRRAMEALNVASRSDVQRLESRLRAVAARLEDMEDRIDEVADQIAALRRRVEPSGGSG